MTEMLLVGDAAPPLSRLRQSVEAEERWRIVQAPSAEAGLGLLETRGADVVVAALGTDVDHYAEFFRSVSQVAPRTIRIALCSERDTGLRIEHAHQTLAVRKDMGYLLPCLRSAASVAERTNGRTDLQRIITRLRDVPSPPTLYFDIREELENEAGTTGGMATVAARDPALVARILKMANSGFFGLPRTVSDLKEAVGLVGVDAVLGLVLASHLFSGLPPPGLRLEVLWEHVIRVSKLARKIARLEGGSREDESLAAVAGLLHDIGLMVLLQNESARYQPIWQETGGDETALAARERETFGISHGELGAIILMLWGLPQPVVNAVAGSHAPGAGQ